MNNRALLFRKSSAYRYLPATELNFRRQNCNTVGLIDVTD